MVFGRDLDRPGPHDLALDALAPGERARAERFGTPLLGRRWSASRAALRALLPLFGLPATTEIATAPGGKPELRGSEIRFSMSHSENVALYAFASGRDVGVDIEIAPRLEDCLALAHRFLAPEEAAAIAVLPDGMRHTAFLEVWSAKEAVLKALGRGIADGLDRFVVARAQGGRLVVRRSELADLRPEAVEIVDLRPHLGAAAALAVIPRSTGWVLGAPRSIVQVGAETSS